MRVKSPDSIMCMGDMNEGSIMLYDESSMIVIRQGVRSLW